jgi:hypothetical protein
MGTVEREADELMSWRADELKIVKSRKNEE